MSLFTFILESNKIEGIEGVTEIDIEAHERLLRQDKLDIEQLVMFVADVARARLRDEPGMDVRVGTYAPPPGGPEVVRDLRMLVKLISTGSLNPYVAHHHYEQLHPFMDGNGRSGRAIWLWQLSHTDDDAYAFALQLGFLHMWYYQSLRAEQT